MDLLASIQSWQPNPLEEYEPTVGCSPFHLDQALLRILRAPNQIGKAQPIDARVLTPSGWRCIGDLVVGDEVIAGDGSVTRVTGVYPQGARSVLRLTFDDGASTRSDVDHLWVVKDYPARFERDHPRFRAWSTITAGEIRRRWGDTPSASQAVVIPVIGRADARRIELPLDPYLLGVLLGDGCLRQRVSFSTSDAEILAEVKAALPGGVSIVYRGKYDYDIIGTERKGSHRVNPVLQAIRQLGLEGAGSADKRIPDAYMFTGADQRLALLQGLMDTDGSIAKGGAMEFTSISWRLAEGVCDLVRSLGGKSSLKERARPSYTAADGTRREGARAWRVRIRISGVDVFRLSRKRERRLDPASTCNERVLRSIVSDGDAECVCIAVAHSSMTYITDDYIVTHNTYAGIAEDWWFLTDLHPYRPRHHIAQPKLVVLIAQKERSYAEFCEKMRALEPPGILADGVTPLPGETKAYECRYIKGEGYTYRGSHCLVLRTGAQAVFVGGEGQSIGGSGSTADALHVDEPPKESHLEEAMRAVMHRNGPIWATLTPVGRPVAYLKLRVEGDRENGILPMEDWHQTVPALTVEACRLSRSGRLTRDEASIKRQIAAYTGSPNEAQRLRGAWDGVATGRRFPAYHPGKHYVDCRLALKGISLERIRLSVDYGEHPETLIAGLMVEARGKFYTLSERPGRDNGLPASIARDMADMCLEWGIPLPVFSGKEGPTGYASIHGDINSLGLAGGGLSANEALAAALVGAGFPPTCDVWPPAAGKGRGSIVSGEVALNVMCAQDRYFVDHRCKRAHHAMSYHVAGQQDTKHAIDMGRYGMADRWIATMGRPISSSRVVTV